MPRKAFCGNGFIHLNVAEIHEEGIAGQKTCAPIADQGIKMSEFADCRDFEVKFVKYPLGEAQMLQMSGRLIVEMILVENELSCDWTQQFFDRLGWYSEGAIRADQSENYSS